MVMITTIGCAAVIKQEVQRGDHQFAGAIGHVVVRPGGEQCICGKRGCLETVAGEQAVRAAGQAAARDGRSPRLVELHRLENEGDEIYHTAVAELFQKATDPLTVIKWKDIYEKLEAAVDRCENVANIIESVIIKHN